MNSRRIPSVLVSVLVLTVLLLALAAPAYAQGNGNPGLVAFGSDITVRSGDVIAGDVVAFGGNITVEPQARVNGGVVAFGGNVSCGGQVTGSVVAFGGSIRLLAGSTVEEDVVVLGGVVDQAEGARVQGNINRGFVFSVDDWQSGRTFPRPAETWPFSPAGERGSLLASILFGMLRAAVSIVVLTAVAVVLVALFPKPIEGVKATLSAQPASSAGIGCLGYVAAALLTVPLILTCIGPFLLWAAMAIAAVFGLAAMGLWLGDRLLASSGGRQSTLVTAALGTGVLVMLLSVVDIVPFVNCFGWVLWLVVSTIALGAVIWSRFGTQVPPSAAEPPPATGPLAAPEAVFAPPSTTPPPGSGIAGGEGPALPVAQPNESAGESAAPKPQPGDNLGGPPPVT